MALRPPRHKRKPKTEEETQVEESLSSTDEAKAVIRQIQLSPTAALVKRLLPHIPLNEYGLPLCIYRPDLLPDANDHGEVIREDKPFTPPSMEDKGADLDGDPNLDEDEDGAPDAGYTTYEYDDRAHKVSALRLEPNGDGRLQVMEVQEIKTHLPTSDELNLAQVDILYDESFPTMGSGMPFWSPFDWEERDAFLALEVYLTMPTANLQGVRRLADIPAALAMKGVEVTLVQIKTWYYAHYWQWRAKAYDIFRQAQWQLQQQERSRAVVDLQYARAQKIMGRLMEYMEDEEEFWGLMTPIAAINLFKEAIKLERLSAGLPAGSPADVDGGARGGKSSGAGQGAGGVLQDEVFRRHARGVVDQAVQEEEETQQIESLLEDTDSFEMLQSLVFKLMERPHHKERQQVALAAPPILDVDPDAASES